MLQGRSAEEGTQVKPISKFGQADTAEIFQYSDYHELSVTNIECNWHVRSIIVGHQRLERGHLAGATRTA